MYPKLRTSREEHYNGSSWFNTKNVIHSSPSPSLSYTYTHTLTLQPCCSICNYTLANFYIYFFKKWKKMKIYLHWKKKNIFHHWCTCTCAAFRLASWLARYSSHWCSLTGLQSWSWAILQWVKSFRKPKIRILSANLVSSKHYQSHPKRKLGSD